jgi:hypothetical protein
MGGSKNSAIVKERNHVYSRKSIGTNLAYAREGWVVSGGSGEIEGNVIPMEGIAKVPGVSHTHLKASDMHPQGKVR